MQTKTISIHQPNFVPWLGYFHKIAHCDAFVLLDDVKYTKNSYINRNRIKTAQGVSWLTLPVKYSGRSHQVISSYTIDSPDRSKTKLLKTVESNYAKALNFHQVFPEFREQLLAGGDSLSQTNEGLIRWAMSLLDISTPIIHASSLGLSSQTGTERLVAICQALDAHRYLAGLGAQKYQEDQLFTQANIQVRPSNFSHPVYPQLFGNFEPNLSVLDYLMNREAVKG